MPKMLTQRDFDLSSIGMVFELDEVTPVFEMEHRTDENGVIETDKKGEPRKFPTDKIIGYNYSVTILDGNFRKKATQIKILDPELKITNEEILKRDSVKCNFIDLEVSMVGNPMYYRAKEIILLDKKAK